MRPSQLGRDTWRDCLSRLRPCAVVCRGVSGSGTRLGDLFGDVFGIGAGVFVGKAVGC